MEKIVVGTSLAPFDFEKQMVCLKTWIDSGFEVISFNNKKEIELLKPYFEKLGVIFYEINRDASDAVGKPLPYINDILCEVSRRTERICGYFNADILLHGVSESLYEFICNEAKNSLVYVRRNEISKGEDILKLNWQIHFDGIDVFFLDKKFANLFFEEAFFVQSAWDLFILEKCKIKGIKVKELINPIAFHKRHSVKWNFDMCNHFAEEFEKRYYGTSKNAYEKTLSRFYCNVLEFTQKICYSNATKEKCLLILEAENEETVRSIKEQEDVQVTIKSGDVMQGLFDYTICVKKKAILDRVFCKLVIYLMEQYNLSELEMGRFFVSEREGNLLYNSLNRNVDVVKEINEVSQVYTTVHRNGFITEKKAKIFVPISQEKINLDVQDVIERKKVSGNAYLMPAGVRANEWYEVNRHRLKEINIKGFLDNNMEKVGKSLAKKTIYFAKEVLKTDKNAWVILASKYYNQEIKMQLLEFMSGDRIIDAGYTLQIDDAGNFYCFDLEKYKQYHL